MRIICLVFLLCLLSFPQQSSAQVLVIKAGKLVDPASGEIANDQSILIENGIITSVGSAIAIPDKAAIIDLSDKYLLPGLFDAHTHLCTDVALDESWQGQVTERFTSYTLQNSTVYRALTGVAKAAEMLTAGFTTVRDLGNAGNYADSELRRAIENGLIPGPTVINSGRIIAPFGGQLHLHAERPEAGIPEYFHADTRDEILKAVRENIHFGARVIKVVVDDQPYIYSAEDLKLIVDEAAKAGLKVAAHCHTEAGALNAIAAGVASIEHGTQMNNEVLQLAKANNVALVGTEMPKWVLALFGSAGRHATVVDRLRRAQQVGVTLVYGSDALYEVGDRSRGEMALVNLESWQAAGISPADMLRAMTTSAAKLCGVENVRGAIKTGLAADIIAVENNPLEDIWALKDVRFVMKDGKVYKSR